MQPSLLREAATLSEQGVPCALAVVVAATGSVPGKVGATMLVTVEGTSRGTVGGAGLEERVKKLCADAIRRGEGGIHSFDLARWKEGGLDSVCGGTVDVAIHVLRATPHLLLVGGGHCTQALARTCDLLDWAYTVVDSRKEYADATLFPRARETVHATPADWLRRHDDLSRFSHVYLFGHSHHEDGDALIALLESGYAGILGAIGSKAKLRAFRDRAREKGVPESAFARVRMPLGLDIGSQTPAEIAVAVAAQIIQDIHGSRAREAAEPTPRLGST